MASDMAQKFMDTLQEIENSKDVTPLVQMFAEDAELRRLSQETMTGKDGAREFWEEYLEMFETIHSDFNHVIEGDTGILLEWKSSGKLANGKALEYRGVSIFEADGDKVTNFRTYYDSAVFTGDEVEGAKHR